MHLVFLDWIIITLFLALISFLGIYYAKNASKSLEHFFLGGRQLPWWLAGISMVATTFAADTPLAVTEIIGKNGIAGNWLWWNMLAGGMLTTFFFAKLWKRSGVLTEVEFITLRYHGPQARFLRGFKAIYLGVFMNMLILAWVNIALQSLLLVFFELPLWEARLYTFLAMLAAMSYSALSGLKGVAITDALQFLVAILGCLILAILVLQSPEIGGISGLKAQLQEQNPASLNFLPTLTNDVDGLGKTLGLSFGAFFAYVGMQWWSSWYPGAEPGGGGYIAQRMMSTPDEKQALWATLFFQVAHYCVRPWPWIIVGLAATILYPNLSEADLKLGFVYAMRDYLPDGWRGLLLVSFLAAYMSTISTQLNWGASYLVNDFYKVFIRTDSQAKEDIKVSRLATFLLMLLGFGMSFFIESISGTWELILQFGGGLGLVLILRWYWWRINAWAEIAATITPVLLTLWTYSMAWKFTEAFTLIVCLTTVTWLIVMYATAPTDKLHLQAFYDRVRPEGFWNNSYLNIVEKKTTSIPLLFLTWGLGISFTYSVLFCIGKCIFMEWSVAIYLGIWSILSLFGLIWSMSQLENKKS